MDANNNLPDCDCKKGGERIVFSTFQKQIEYIVLLYMSCSSICTASEFTFYKMRVLLTIDDSSHSPETQQDKKTHSIKYIIMEDEDYVQHKRHHHHQSIKHLEFMLEELKAICEEFPGYLHHEECEKCQAHVVKHLPSELLITINYCLDSSRV